MNNPEREAMTLERQAFEEWAESFRLSMRKSNHGVYIYTDTTYAWAGWKAAIANLSRTTEPVGVAQPIIVTGVDTGKFTAAIFKSSEVPAGTRIFTHPPEPARDADTWRKYCDDAAAEAIKKYAAKGDVEGAVLFMRITCGPPGKITQKEIDAAMAQESGE